MTKRGFYVIAYDIPDDTRRLKVARLLERFGDRVQHSVFELYLTPEEVATLEARLRALLNEAEDVVHWYALCALCRQRTRVLGRGQTTSPPPVVKVI